jgi:hypothetical protein
MRIFHVSQFKDDERRAIECRQLIVLDGELQAMAAPALDADGLSYWGKAEMSGRMGGQQITGTLEFQITATNIAEAFASYDQAAQTAMNEAKQKIHEEQIKNATKLVSPTVDISKVTHRGPRN